MKFPPPPTRQIFVSFKKATSHTLRLIAIYPRELELNTNLLVFPPPFYWSVKKN